MHKDTTLITGAARSAKLGSAVGHRRFIQPWMVEFAGEHFEFDLSKTRRELGWEPTTISTAGLSESCASPHITRSFGPKSTWRGPGEEMRLTQRGFVAHGAL